jgi:mRNA interferase RelE/StbE
MQVIYLKSFLKDIDKLRNKQVAANLLKLVSEIEKIEDPKDIKGLKKLKGHQYAYWIRIQDYRLGIFIEENQIVFTRFLPRKDIYKYFPK